MKKRIWELDALRGLFLIGVVAFHLMYDLIYLFGLVSLTTPAQKAAFFFFSDWYGLIYLLLSGLCATIGSHPIKQGLLILSGGLVINAVTLGIYFLNFAGPDIIIYFGVLHCIGTCMLLWPLFRKLPPMALLAVGLLLIAVGSYLSGHVRADFPWLVPLGVIPRNFASSDYFPLLPNLGYFLLGAALGKRFYRAKTTLLPKVNDQNSVIRFFCFLGKHSLSVYLLHQPILAGLISGWVLLTRN